MTMIRFVVAPDWFMKMEDTAQVTSKVVLELYGYADGGNLSSSSHYLVKRGSLPPPDIKIKRNKTHKIAWTVGYLKNFMKLPTEIRPLDAELEEYYCEEKVITSKIRVHKGSRY